MSRFSDFQFEIYRAGVVGDPPALPMTALEVERAAQQVMTPRAYGYVAGSAGTETTERANRSAFERWEIVPRHLKGVPERDLSIELFGDRLPTPVLLAPIGAMGIIRKDAELAVARAASSIGVPMVLSTVSGNSLEEVAKELASGTAGVGWFQLYWPSDRELALSLVRRAEAAGYRAVVVTLDTWTLSWRPRDLANGYLPFLTGEGLANYFSDPVFQSRLTRSPEEDPEAAINLWSQLFGYPGLRPADLRWLREQTALPILVKGVCHPGDARSALEAGLDGIVVSNHGGRQVDGARSALDCLPEVAAASGDMAVLFDSGIRTGSDVVKALALGAKAVLLGRPYVFGLALAGEEGVRHVLRCLLAELELTVGLSGHASVAELNRESLGRA
ncbi:MAG: lactate 2-monooxygenase [Candidatus Dormibacteria bacterium]